MLTAAIHLPAPSLMADRPSGVDLLTSPEGDMAALTHDVLDVLKITQSVQSDQAGAIATFIGTTRDNFKGLSSPPEENSMPVLLLAL